MMETSRSPHQQAFPRKPPLIRILDIRVKLLIYTYKLWDGWTPNSQFKYLFSQPFYFSASADAPTCAPCQGCLLQDVVGRIMPGARLPFRLLRSLGRASKSRVSVLAC